jgi:hypothetical protein
MKWRILVKSCDVDQDSFILKHPDLAAVYEFQDKFEFSGLVMDASMTGRAVNVTAEKTKLAVAQTVDQSL